MAKKHARGLDFTAEVFEPGIVHVQPSPQMLSEKLGDLRYDGLAEYLAALAGKLQRDSESDGGRGRGKLAERLQRAAFALDEATFEIAEAWKICEPYMKQD